MELIEIIKQTIFLIILLGFGIFSLSYSIYKIRTRNKFEQTYQPSIATQQRLAELVVKTDKNIQKSKSDSHKITSERFIVINQLSSNDERADSVKKKTKNGYQLNSIRNTGMYTLTFD
ncbi:MAG TPA: hypothetical protein VK870_14020 [Ignavibacteriaceae bacterium]|nr:hypothetical protein [Ignavibacteriaceae bacterium]